MEPPPGAGDSLAVSSANSAQVMSTSFLRLSSAASRYSITFSSGLKGFRSSSPIDLTAIRMISLSAMPVERCCFARK